ncbi:MAG TPA: biotin/lipoyl-containing protein [Armatimonadota bacterium]|nr:biotin/lipoyl-containing protein [Armatimonadota bacterium]
MANQSQVHPSDITELIRIACQHGFSEIAIQSPESQIQIRLAPTPQSSGVPPAAESPVANQPAADCVPLLSPMTGIYYAAPGPNAPPFVHPGDLVREGDPIGLIEAMKVFSEVLADHSGRVRRVVAENGQLVQQGDMLIELSALEAGEV